MLITSNTLTIHWEVLVQDSTGITDLECMNVKSISTMLLTNRSIQHVSSNTTKTSNIIRTTVARSYTRLAKLTIICHLSISMLRTFSNTRMIVKTKSTKTISTILTIKTHLAITSTVITHLRSCWWESTSWTVLMTSVVMKIIPSGTKQTSGVVTVQATIRTRNATLSSLVSIKSKRTDY